MKKTPVFRSAIMTLILFLLVVLACKMPGSSGTPFQNGNYVGNINGAEAIARVSFEPLREYTIMSGEIRSNNFYYTFTSDIVGTEGYGEIVDHHQNTRFKIKIELTQNGFVLTTNPLGPGNPTAYNFFRK